MRPSLFTFPELSTSSLRELQWSTDWWKRQYAEAGYHCELAWQNYNDAIDNGESNEQISNLFIMATMFEAIKIETYRKWDNAKTQYLAILN